MRANHDCQYLFTRTHALAIIYYVMKYISKAETSTYSKLTIAAAVAKALATTPKRSKDIGKSMLVKLTTNLPAIENSALRKLYLICSTSPTTSLMRYFPISTQHISSII